MWHGGGMTGVNWEQRRTDVLAGRCSSYALDSTLTFQMPWSAAVHPGRPTRRSTARRPISAQQKTFGRRPSASAHRAHGIPTRRCAAPIPAWRFPIEYFDAFLCQCVPRWDCNDVLTQQAYDSLVQRMETGAILLTHSQGGNFGLTAAANHPDRVHAVVSLEPSGAPDPSLHDATKLRSVPHLLVWGDFLEKHTFWVHSRPTVERWRDSLRSAGCDVTWIELPSRDIHGNSHALMSDDNGDAVAGIVLDWLRQRGLAAPAVR